MGKVAFWPVLTTEILIGFVIYEVNEMFSARIDPKLATFVRRVQSDLRGKGYFMPREIGFPNAVFFCICGPYASCRRKSDEIASALDYKMPEHDFVDGMSRSRQLLIYFLPEEVVSIEMPNARRSYD